MTEIFIGAAAGLSVAVLGAVAMRINAKKEQARETAEAVRRCQEGGARILAVDALKRAYLDLVRQHGAGYGPWISSCLQRAARGGDVDPGVALTAVRWTIRDIISRPSDLDAEVIAGQQHFDLTGLEMAARELEGLAG